MEAKVTCFKVEISCFPLVHASENLLQVMFVHLLRSYKLESVEELPKKPVLGKDSFLMPEGLDKITLVKRVDNWKLKLLHELSLQIFSVWGGAPWV